MKIKYKDHRFSKSSLDVIATANEILGKYQSMGFDMTLRQLYYQFVAGDLIPNTQASYSRLGSIVNDARLAGLVSWWDITDRMRSLAALSHWRSPKDIVEAAASSYAIDLRVNQDRRIEVWVEKDALSQVVRKACDPWDVPYFACRGYVSQSAMWKAARRIIHDGRPCCIFHLGDHDPSGIDMTRDNQDRLSMFGADVAVRRIALSMDQVSEHRLPSNPAKLSDSRAGWYVNEHGPNSWELDALPPNVLLGLIDRYLCAETEMTRFNERKRQQANDKAQLLEAAENFE